MADVTLSAALRSNLLSLQNTQRATDQTQLRLASGKKVNSALDDPGAFFASQGLTNRASDLSSLLDGIGQAVQSLTAANQGITALTKLLGQAQAIAQQAKDQTTGGAIAKGASMDAGEAADLTTVGTTDAGDDIVIRKGGAGEPEHTFTIKAGQSLQDLADEINSSIAGITATVEASGVAGEVRIRLQTVDGSDITIKDGPASVTSTHPAAADIFGTAGSTAGVTTAATNVAAPKDQVTLEASFNTLRTQIDQLVVDANYRGTNLLKNGTLTVKFNEDNTSTLGVNGVDFTSAGLNITAADFSSGTAIDATLTAIKTALDSVRAQSSTFGTNLTVIQNRQDFTMNLINTLKAGSDALTNADQNEEGAKLLALQTAQSLGVTSLSLASQAQQSVLRLFG